VLVDAGVVVTALLAALAAGWGVRSPAEQLARTQDPGRTGQPAGPPGWRRFWAARLDAAPLRRRVLVSLAGAVGAALAVRALGGSMGMIGWFLLPVLALVGTVGLGKLESSDSRSRQERLVLDMPQALDLLAAALAAGLPLRQATGAVTGVFDGPVGADLDQVLTLVDLGVSDAEAWRSLSSSPHWGAVAVDVARSVESGTLLVDVLVHHAGAARRLRRAALEVRAKAVGVRSVLPLMTCFLPAFLLLGVIPTVASAVLAALS